MNLWSSASNPQLAQPLAQPDRTQPSSATTKGRLYGIGVGPGDPELITLKALRILQAAPVIAYQSASDRPSLARSIVAQYLPGHQIEVPFHLPRALDGVAAKDLYDKLIPPIEEYLISGQDVVVLCEGDPLFYGSFMYVFTRLCDRYETEVIPGISSPMGCAAAVGIPISYRNDVFSVLPAPLPAEVLAQQLRQVDAAAIIKLQRHFDKVRQVLQEVGLAERASYVERGTMRNQKILRLDEVDPAQVPYFALILVPSVRQL